MNPGGIVPENCMAYPFIILPGLNKINLLDVNDQDPFGGVASEIIEIATLNFFEVSGLDLLLVIPAPFADIHQEVIYIVVEIYNEIRSRDRADDYLEKP